YPISDSYIVETKVSKQSLKYETRYVSNLKVHYTITWKKGHAKWSVSSMKSSIVVVNTFLQKINQKPSTKLFGSCLFGFDIELLYYTYLQIACIKFKNSNFTTQARLDAIVYVYDEALLDRDGYKSLVAVVPTLFCEYLIANYRNKINKLMNIWIRIKIFNINKEIDDQFSIDSSEYTSNILVNNSEIENGPFVLF
ncbi:27307_t:CDS:2, partial [Gigaspora margarita]